ncbi:MAG: hypothetical protein ABL958_09490, partial [Bdellovibrionia bacterium]
MIRAILTGVFVFLAVVRGEEPISKPVYGPNRPIALQDINWNENGLFTQKLTEIEWRPADTTYKELSKYKFFLGSCDLRQGTRHNTAEFSVDIQSVVFACFSDDEPEGPYLEFGIASDGSFDGASIRKGTIKNGNALSVSRTGREDSTVWEDLSVTPELEEALRA